MLLAFGGGGGGLGRGDRRRLARLVLTLETCLTELNSLVRVSFSDEDDDELDTVGVVRLVGTCCLLPLLRRNELVLDLSD